MKLQACNGAVRIPPAQEEAQSAAAGAQIYHPGIFGQAHKIPQNHGIRAQGEGIGARLKGHTA